MSSPERSYFEDVREWHKAFGIPAPEHLIDRLPADRVALRKTLVGEEYAELMEAMDANDLIAIADACADLVVTALGTAVEYGILFDAVWEEVHRTNLAKRGADGEVIRRADGKIMKPPDWQPPDIANVIQRQA